MNYNRHNTYQALNPIDMAFEEADREARFKLPLNPDVRYRINPDTPIMHDNYFDCDIIAQITADRRGPHAGGGSPDSFLVADIRGVYLDHAGHRHFGDFAIDPSVDFLLVGKDFNNRGRGFKGIWPGRALTLGRGDEATNTRFGLGNFTSRRHFQIEYTNPDEGLFITDLRSNCGTSIAAASPLTIVPPAGHQGYQQRNHHRQQQQQPRPQAYDPALQHRIDELRGFLGQGNQDPKAQLSDNTLVQLIQQVDAMKPMPDRKRSREIAIAYHPDRANGETDAHRRHVLFQAAHYLTRK